MSAIKKAAEMLRREAESMKECHTVGVGGEWYGDSAKDDYDEKIAAADAAIAERDALRAKVERMEQQEPVALVKWQPIETAPRNQAFLAVLNCAGEQTICTMRWPVAEAKNSRPDSKTFHVERVTHWMPLPDLPGAQAQPAPSIPEGWKLVPTAESRHPGIYKMLSALHAVDNTPGASEWASYAAMLAVTPEFKP